MRLYLKTGTFSTMLRHSVFLVSLTMVLCTSKGHRYSGPFGGFGQQPGLIVQQRDSHGPDCRPVQSVVTHVRTVVQEQPILKTVQRRVVEFRTRTLQTYVTVTTGSVAYITTTVLLTDFNTRTRTVTQRETETHTRYAYIPTVETAIVAAVQNAIITNTQVAYETVFTPHYVTSTLTTVSTQLRDEAVYDVVYETEFNFIAAPVTTTVTEQIPDPTTQTVQVQGFSPPVVRVSVDKVAYETQVLYHTVPLYVTSRVQAVEYHTVTNNIPVTATVTATVDCYGQPVNRGPAGIDAAAADAVGGLSRTGDIAAAGGVALPALSDATLVSLTDSATGGAVARAGSASSDSSTTGVSDGADGLPQVLSGVLLSSNSDTSSGRFNLL